MEEYEKEKLDLFYNIYLDNYINNLEKTNSADFSSSPILDLDAVPFNVYSDLAINILEELKDNENAENLIKIILRDSYFYSLFRDDNNGKSIINIVTNNEVATISYYMAYNKLLAASIIKNFVNYLLLLEEDEEYKSLLSEEANKDILAKLTPNKINFFTINAYLRDFLMNIYNELTFIGNKDEDIFTMFDKILLDYDFEFLIDDNSEHYTKSFVYGLICIIYETAFVYICHNQSNDKNINNILKYLNNNHKEYKLPANKKSRWTLYSIFINMSLSDNISKDITDLQEKDYKILSKIYPAYFLDGIN